MYVKLNVIEDTNSHYRRSLEENKRIEGSNEDRIENNEKSLDTIITHIG